MEDENGASENVIWVEKNPESDDRSARKRKRSRSPNSRSDGSTSSCWVSSQDRVRKTKRAKHVKLSGTRMPQNVVITLIEDSIVSLDNTQSEDGGDLDQDIEPVEDVKSNVTGGQQKNNKEGSMSQNEQSESEGERNLVNEETHADAILSTDLVKSDTNEMPTNKAEKDDGENTKPASETIEEEVPCTLLNTRALLKEAKTYQLEKFKKNAFLIFNQENIIGYEPRLGTREDGNNLRNTFKSYGFEIEEHFDLCRDDIFRKLKQFSGKDFTDYGCVAVAILTHGSEKGELRAADRIFYESDVLGFFKNRSTLVTKPKIFIIQACRGAKTTKPVNVLKRGVISTDHDDNPSKQYTLPMEADILVLHSTYEGNQSHRDSCLGSWLVETLCKKIRELASTEDLDAIMLEVKREVATDKENPLFNLDTYETDKNKQMPVVNSTLIRKLYFRKYEGHDVPETSKASIDILYSTPTISQSGTDEVVALAPCACFQNRFEYYRHCIESFVQENPGDEMAESIFAIAKTALEGPEFYPMKRTVSDAITQHLREKAKGFKYFKYLYLFKEPSTK